MLLSASFVHVFCRKFPTLLEYFGYLFHFSGFLVGPTNTFREYIDFIEGKDIERALEESKVHLFVIIITKKIDKFRLNRINRNT